MMRRISAILLALVLVAQLCPVVLAEGDACTCQNECTGECPVCALDGAQCALNATEPTETSEATEPTETSEATEPTETSEPTEPTETVPEPTPTCAHGNDPEVCATCADYATLAQMIAALPSAEAAKSMTLDEKRTAYAAWLEAVEFCENKGLTLTADQEAFLGELNQTLNEPTYSVEATPNAPDVQTAFMRNNTEKNCVEIWGETSNTDPTRDLHIDLYAGETKIGSVKLNDVGGIYAATTSTLTWHMMVLGTEYDDYWTTTWETGYPKASVKPDKIVLFIDGEKVDEGEVKESAPDDLNPVIWEELFAAEYNGTTYGTVQAAINAAGTTAGATVNVIHNITKQPEKDITIAANQDIILDLGGHEVKGDFMVYGKATIKNGTITGTRDDFSAIEANGTSADMTLENLIVTSMRHGVRVDNAKQVTINSGTYSSSATSGTVHGVNISGSSNVTITGGTFSGPGLGDDGDCAITTRDNSTLTITGGEFKNESGNFTVGAWGGTLNISGGIFHKSLTDSLNLGGEEKGTSTTGITGGYFEDKPDTALLQLGKAAILMPNGNANGDYKNWYQITDAAAMVDEEPYASILDAFTVVQNNQTIKLLQNGSLSDSFVLDTTEAAKDITLNLNNFSLTGIIKITDLDSSVTVIGSNFNADQVKFQGSPEKGYTITQKVENNDDGSVTYSYVKTANEYTITYVLNGGTNATSNPATYTVTTGTITLADATRTGYTFAGWFDTTLENQVTSIASSSCENITLYATWTPITYTVDFDANGGSGSMDSQTLKYDEAKALTANAFTKDNMRFAGWATSASGSVAYANGASVKNLANTQGATVTLYAVWTTKEVLNPDLPAKEVYTWNDKSHAYDLDSSIYTVTYKQGNNVVTNPTEVGVYDVYISAAATNEYEAYSTTVPGGLVIAPAIIEGANQSAPQGSAPQFRSNANYNDFVRVEVDGVKVAPEHYDSKSGSIIVTLHADFVSRLASGKHTLSIVSTLGGDEYGAKTTFTVKKNSSGSSSSSSSGDSYVVYDRDCPKTGDITHTGLYLALALVGTLGILALLLTKKYLIKRR